MRCVYFSYLFVYNVIPLKVGLSRFYRLMPAFHEILEAPVEIDLLDFDPADKEANVCYCYLCKETLKTSLITQ